MKLGRIAIEGPDGEIARLVAVLPQEQRVVDLKKAWALSLQKEGATRDAANRLAEAVFPGSMSAAIALGDWFLKTSRQALGGDTDKASIPLDSVRWLGATDPSVVRDGLTFIDHIKGFHTKMKATPAPGLLKVPGYFKGTPHTIIGHEADVPWPGFIDYMDYELELGYVIGRQGHNVRPEQARDYLFGITIFNDFSGRDRQSVEMGIGMGPSKSKDFAYGIGPWITTIDEFEDLEKISMEVRVNGKTISTGVSANKLWSVEELIAYVSLADWITPGDVIGSGTMGKGSGLELDLRLQPGDVVELEVGGVGVLRNRCGQPEQGLWWPQERVPFM